MRSRRRRADLTVIPGEGRRDIYYKQAAIYYLIIALAMLLFLLAGYRWLGGMLLTRRLQVVVAEPGTLEDRCFLEGVIVRNEQVILAPCSGLLLEMAPPGERVAVGAKVASVFRSSREELSGYREEAEDNLWDRIKGFIYGTLGKKEVEKEEDQSPPIYAIPAGTTSWPDRIEEIYAPAAGLLSPRVDGWEDRPHPPYLDRETFAEQYPGETLLTAGSYVEEGTPILKIVNNWVWYFSALTSYENELAGRDKIWLTFSFAPEEAVEAVLEEVCTDPGSGATGITYRLEHQLEGFEENRWAGSTGVYQRYHGILVPIKALLKDPETGLYVDEGGIVTFSPVKVIKVQDDQVLVEGLPPYSRVITRPELIEEGYRLN